MRSKSISQLTQFLSGLQKQRLATLSERHCFSTNQPFRLSTSRVLRDDTRPPKDEPKSSLGTKSVGFLIGGGVALTYAWYKSRNGSDASVSAQPDGFVKYTLIDQETTSSTCAIFTLQPVSRKSALKTTSLHGSSIASVQIKQPQLQIARSYTCLPQVPGQPEDSIRLLIRREDKGEVSRYLYSLAPGSDVELRGFQDDFVFPKDTREVVFLAGGTGIAPALKAAEILRDKASIHILWANKNRDDCVGGRSDTESTGLLISLLSIFGRQSNAQADSDDIQGASSNTIVLLLGLLKNAYSKQQTPAKHMKVDYFVDSEGSYIRPSMVNRSIREAEDGAGQKVIVVSGPSGFVNHWAGPKQWIEGREDQGPLRGKLANMNLTGWTVVKL